MGNRIVQGDGRLHAADQPSQPLARHRPFGRLDGGVVDVADEVEEGTRGSQIIATQDALLAKWIGNAICSRIINRTPGHIIRLDDGSMSSVAPVAQVQHISREVW